MIQTLWQEFLTIVREEVGSNVVETWFKAVHCVRWDSHNKVVHLSAPNPFVKDWISQHYHDLFIKHLSRLLNEQQVSIVVTDNKSASFPAAIQPAIKAPVVQPIFTAAKSLKQSPVVALKALGTLRNALNPAYVFDSFVVGPSNKLAFSAALAVSEKPARQYNPLFIYGPSGLGKTHLLHAIGNKIKEQNRQANILYQSADRFVNEFINAIRFDKVYQFESKYKDIDVLLVDDIQFISNKEQTQEAFFHIFNTLHQSHKQIVVTSDSMPCDIAGLAERMRSRLEGGLIADIQIPTLETKIAILKKKASLSYEELPDDVAYFIASQGFTNIREIEGALIRLFASSSLTKQALTLELAQKIFQRSKSSVNQPPDLMTIAQRVVEQCQTTLAELRSAKRDKEITFARHIAMYLMKKHTNHSLKDIGMFLARRDHTTVMHAYEKILQQIELKPEISEIVGKIENELRLS